MKVLFGAVREAVSAHHQIRDVKMKDSAHKRYEEVLKHSQTHIDPHAIKQDEKFKLGKALHNFVLQSFYLPSERIQAMFEHHHQEIIEDLANGKKVKGLEANATEAQIKDHAAASALRQSRYGNGGLLDTLVNRSFLIQSGFGILGDIWGLFTNPDKAASIASLISDSLQVGLNFIPKLPAAATVGLNFLIGPLQGIVYNLLGGGTQQTYFQTLNGINGLTSAQMGGAGL